MKKSSINPHIRFPWSFEQTFIFSFYVQHAQCVEQSEND